MNGTLIEIARVHTVIELPMGQISTETYGNYPVIHKAVKGFSVRPEK